MLPGKLHSSQAEVIGFTMEATLWNVVAFGVPVVCWIVLTYGKMSELMICSRTP